LFDCIGSVGDSACRNLPHLCEVRSYMNSIPRSRGLSLKEEEAKD